MNEYQSYLIQEFADEYNQGHMTRRQLLRRAVLIMGSVPAGMSALAVFGCGGDDDDEAADAASSPEPPATSTAATGTTSSPAPSGTGTNDSLQLSDVKFPGPGSELLGYLAKPPGAGPHPGIVIIHENRGLNDHTKDIARRYAQEGFIGLAVDLVSRAGGTKADASANTGVLGSANIPDLIADMKAYVGYLKTLDRCEARRRGCDRILLRRWVHLRHSGRVAGRERRGAVLRYLPPEGEARHHAGGDARYVWRSGFAYHRRSRCC